MRLLDFLRRNPRRGVSWKGFPLWGKKRKKRPPESAPNRGIPPNVLTFSIAAAVMIVVWATASVSIVHRRAVPYFHYVVGQTANSYVYSEVPFEYEDLNQTQRKREQTASQEPPVYQLDHALANSVLDDLTELHALILARLQDPQAPGGEVPDSRQPKGERARELLGILTHEQVTSLEYVLASREKWKLLHKLCSEALRQGLIDSDEKSSLAAGVQSITRVQIADAEIQSARRSFCSLDGLPTPQEAAERIARDLVQGFPENAVASQNVVRSILLHLLQPNLSYDFHATRQARERAAREIETVRRLVPAGVVLLRRGSKVTEEDILRLERHHQELQSQRSLHESALEVFLSPLLCLLLVLAATYCLSTISPEALAQRGTTVMIGTVLILQIVLSRLAADVYYLNWSSSFYLYPILPLSLGALLLSPLAGLRIAVWAGLLSSLISALQHGRSLQVLIVGGLSSVMAAVLMRRARKRLHAFRAGLGVGISVFATCTVFLFQNEIPSEILPKVLGLALLNGIAVAIVSSSCLPFFEFVFGVTTDLTLLELSDLNHPLLKRLQLEAPGTYHHSLMVATLAEQAAEAIGANPLLARVCAYFHDIGKLSYPAYFSENLYSDNPHEELQPRMSSLVILNHVKAGIDLALSYRLKRPIREAISQHHGTNLVYYFYRRALELKNGVRQTEANVGEHDYRYPGPLPKRKEIVLISIADSCEAASRSLEKPTPQKISALVDEIVQKRIRDHQLDEADLTFAELAVAKETISKTLHMMLHGRVRYPKEHEDEGDLFKTAEKAAAQEKANTPEAPAPPPVS